MSAKLIKENKRLRAENKALKAKNIALQNSIDVTIATVRAIRDNNTIEHTKLNGEKVYFKDSDKRGSDD